MSFNQMQDAYQKTLKQSQAYKQAAQKKAYSNLLKQQQQTLRKETTDEVSEPSKATSQLANTQAHAPLKAELSSTPVASQTQAPLQTENPARLAEAAVAQSLPQQMEAEQMKVPPSHNSLPVTPSQQASSQSNQTPKQQGQAPQQAREQVPQPKSQPTASAASAKKANIYKQNSITTASPGELTLILYNACLRFIEKAEKSLLEKNFDEKNRYIIRAQDIITELMVTLNTETNIGKQMYPLYDFIKNQLVQANIKNDLNALQEAKQFVADFRDTWKQVIQITRKEQHKEASKA